MGGCPVSGKLNLHKHISVTSGLVSLDTGHSNILSGVFVWLSLVDTRQGLCAGSVLGVGGGSGPMGQEKGTGKSKIRKKVKSMQGTILISVTTEVYKGWTLSGLS